MPRNPATCAAIAGLALIAQACGGGDTGAAPLPEPASSASGVAQAREVAVENELYSFAYSYPAEAAMIEGLRALLEQRLAAAQAELKASATEGRADAGSAGYEYHPHYSSVEWTLVANLPRLMSLEQDWESFAGGAHPNHGFDSLVWDKREGRALAPLDLFVSAPALWEAVRERFCTQLDAERAERRGVPVAQASGDEFWKCPRVTDLTLVPKSSEGQRFDRLVLLAAPYVAGPYAEGSYEIELAVEKAVLDAVKAQYRDSFAAGS